MDEGTERIEPHAIARSARTLRVVAFSDCRVQDLKAIVRWIEGRSEKPDLVIYAGDDVGRFVPDPETNYFEQLASLSRYGLVAVTGNDDRPEYRSLIRGHKVYEVHSQPIIIGRFLIVGVEGAPAPGIGRTLHPEPEIADHLRKSIPEGMSHTIIVVSHAPPRSCLDESMRWGIEQIGSTAVGDVVEKEPRVALVVSGHVHNCGGHHDKLGNAIVVNAASNDNGFGSPPTKVAMLLLHPNGTVEDLQWDEVSSSPLRLATEINGVGGAYAQRLAQAGITEIEHLANASPEMVGRMLGWSSRKAAIFVARARARLEGRPILVSIPKLPEMPRLYLDIETDLQQSYTWLVGVAMEEIAEVRQFFAPHPDKEGKMLRELAAFLATKADHCIVHFSGFNFDRRILMQRLQNYVITTPQSLSQSVDCLPALRSSLALPTRRMGLKDASACFGYSFAHPEIDGWQVAYDYQKAIQFGKPVPERLLAYNRDDVLALRFLVQQVEQLAAKS